MDRALPPEPHVAAAAPWIGTSPPPVPAAAPWMPHPAVALYYLLIPMGPEILISYMFSHRWI
jgi:hypothetical protein